jgi:ribonuclease R
MKKPRLSRSAFEKSKTKPAQGLPDRETLLKFLREAGEAAKADMAKAFGLKGSDRRALRMMLKDLEAEGVLGKRGRGGFAEAGALPPVGVADVCDIDTDGDLFVRLVKAGEDVALVRLAPGSGEAAAGAPRLGERVLVRFERLETGEFEAKLIKKLGQSAHKILGVVRKSLRGPRQEVRVEPVDRRSKESLVLYGPEGEKLKDGDLVLAEVGEATGRFGPKRGRVLEVVGREDHPRAASLIAIHTHSLPMGFTSDAEDEAMAAQAPTLQARTDLRHLPLVTIDPIDARDHDDAVYAEPDTNPANPGGWIVWVAIADVAAYVLPGSALDREALDKGNSVYFPDRVEPMLPEHLSNGLCSLRQGETRACMAVRMVFSASGDKTGHQFVRGLMRSAAKLAYEHAQAAIDGEPSDLTGPLLEPVLKPLWAAYACVGQARDRRSPLDIESAERKIQINEAGEVVSIQPRERLTAHRLIEEFMIQANVCAAETLEAPTKGQKRPALIYRVHDTPSQEKVQALADFLTTIQINWSKGEAPRTDRLNRLLEQTRGGPHGEIVNEVVLRSQMQAHYSPDNIGHFGLNLARYAHFTSPIRRYADLIVHRALIRALGLGTDGLTDQEIVRLRETAESITASERRAMAAERDATDRYVAAFLSERVGAEFDGRITGVTRFGLFIRLGEVGADGLVPVSSLGDDYFIHDDKAHCLVGERSGRRWRLGAKVRVKLMEATPITGGLLFQMLSEPDPALPGAARPRLGIRPRPKQGPQGRPRNIKAGGKKRR